MKRTLSAHVALGILSVWALAATAQERSANASRRPSAKPSPSFSQGMPRPQTNQGLVAARPGGGQAAGNRPRPRPIDSLPPGLAPTTRPVPADVRPVPANVRPVPAGGLARPWPNRPDTGNRPNGNTNRPNVNRPYVNRPTVVNKPTNVDVHNRVTNITNNISNKNVYNDNRNIQNNNQNITIINNRPNRGPQYGAGSWNNGWYQGGWNTAVQAPLWLNLPAGGGWFAASADQFGFVNPFWAVNQAATAQYLDYSQRIVVSSSGGYPSPDEAVNQERALRLLDEARSRFRQRDYAGALDRLEQALALEPNDPPLHEFRALCLFALGQFPESAQTLYAVLSSSPGWDGATLRGLYGNLDDYASHLAHLERYLQRNPDSAQGHFLLAYHLATARQYEASLAELDAVQSLLPDDRLIAQLREVLQAEIGA